MDATDVLRRRSLGVGALVLAVVLVAVGVQQAALRLGGVEVVVVVPLVVAVLLAGSVVAAGLRSGRRVASGDRRTPYW